MVKCKSKLNPRPMEVRRQVIAKEVLQAVLFPVDPRVLEVSVPGVRPQMELGTDLSLHVVGLPVPRGVSPVFCQTVNRLAEHAVNLAALRAVPVLHVVSLVAL